MLNSTGWFSNFLAWAEYPFKSHNAIVGEWTRKRLPNTSNKLLKFIRARIGSEGPCWRIMWLRLPLWIRYYPCELVKIQRQSKNWGCFQKKNVRTEMTISLLSCLGNFLWRKWHAIILWWWWWFVRRLSCRNVAVQSIFELFLQCRLLLACKLSSLISYLYTYQNLRK